jgi:hypothetical protein
MVVAAFDFCRPLAVASADPLVQIASFFGLNQANDPTPPPCISLVAVGEIIQRTLVG